MPVKLAALDNNNETEERCATECHRVSADCRVYCVSLCPLPWASDLLLYSTKSTVFVLQLSLPEVKPNQEEPSAFKHETLYKFSHVSRVQCLTWCSETSLSTMPQCVKFITAGSDHVIYIHRRSNHHDNDGLQVASVRGHTDYINDISVCSDDTLVASVSDDCTCRLWHTQTHIHTATIRLSAAGVSVCWHSENSECMLVCCADCCITLYNSLTLQPLSAVHSSSSSSPLSGIVSVDWSSLDPRLLAVLSQNSLSIVSVDNRSETQCEYTVSTNSVQTVKWSPVNKSHVAYTSLDRVVVHELGVKQTLLSTAVKCTGPISWHCTRPYLATASDNHILLWKVVSV